MRALRPIRSSWRAALLVAPLSLLALVAACSGTSDEHTPAAVAPAADSAGPAVASTPAASAAPDLGFPTGPAVTVEVGYEPPRDRVASTGAFLPANGKPTLVYVDAIW